MIKARPVIARERLGGTVLNDTEELDKAAQDLSVSRHAETKTGWRAPYPYTYSGIGIHIDPSTLLTVRLRLDESRYATPAQVSAFYREVLARVRTLPGVAASAVVTGMPYSRNAVNLPLAIEGRPPEKGTPPAVMVQSVSGDYFRALNVPLRAGRLLGDMDGPEQPRVAVVSERLARWTASRNPRFTCRICSRPCAR